VTFKGAARWRRWWLVAIALITLVGCSGHPTDGEPQADSSPELPQQALLTSSMRQQPVPGWTVTVEDLGLPPNTVVRPVGNIGDRGIFLGITDEGWFLLGLDVTSGERLYGPLRLGTAGGATDFNCYPNGPPMVLCVRQGSNPGVPSTAWVVDTSSGKLTFDGPTDLRVASAPDQPSLQQIGDYAIATVKGKGMYGVGSRGELTWFVPGNGILPAQFATWQRDTPASTLAVQGSGRVGDVVFSVVDGTVVKPSLQPDVQLGKAMVYSGGFAYEYTTAGDITTDRIAFFDDSGNKLGEPEPGGTLATRSVDLPLVESKSTDRVFTVDGRELLELPRSSGPPNARLIGTRFYVATDVDHRVWQQFDIPTGKAGKTCEGDSLGFYYIASDGEVVVAHGGDGLLQGVDLTTCEVLWSIPGSAPNEAKEVWKVHTTLVQRTNDRLFSLVAPT
jgi:hypothetical protein